MELIARHTDREAKVHVEHRDDGRYDVTVDDRRYTIDVATAGDILSLAVDDGRQFEVAVRRRRQSGAAHTRYEISSRRGRDTVDLVDPLTHLLEQANPDAGAGGVVEALMPGQVVEVLVEEGTEVERGQGIVVVEAMKMKNEIQADVAGTVATIHVEAGQNVEGGDPLFEIR
ncbi:MAG: biotin/lipoyl-containing protein [Acidobacteriota bacterium]